MACLIATATMMSAGAEEVTLQNDSVVDFSNAVIVGDFIPGEEAAAWLTSPCDGTIVAVQILWLSLPPGAPDTLQENIWIREAGAFPAPGVDLLQLEGPVLNEGGLNEFRYVDEGQLVPIAVPVKEGQTFVVSLEYGEPTDILAGDASVVRDLDGCQSGRNALFAPGLGGWVNFCVFLTGDVAIRAVVDCGVSTGACCLQSGQCVDGQTSLSCVSAGGTFQGNGTECDQTNCPEPAEACCFLPEGCVDLTVDDCQTADGFSQGPGTECDTVICFPMGACCLPNGSCLEDVSPAGCDVAGGVFQGDGVLCGLANCPQPLGACCLSNDACLELPEDDCNIIPQSSWAGPLTTCEDADKSGVADACECAIVPQDGDHDCDIDLFDFQTFVACATGVGIPPAEPFCDCLDADGDGDVDFSDFGNFQLAFTGPGPGCP